MERLTERNVSFCDLAKCDGHCDECYLEFDSELIPGICDGRAVYERLRYWENKLDDGLLLELPQEMVYALVWDAGTGCTLRCPQIPIEGCYPSGYPCAQCEMGTLHIYETRCRQEHLDELGTRYFLTKEEAEARMEEWYEKRMKLPDGGYCQW